MSVRHQVNLPDMGATNSAVVLIEWHVGPGDVVVPGQVVATVETDKVDAEVPSPVGGIVLELIVAPGSELAAEAPICIIET